MKHSPIFYVHYLDVFREIYPVAITIYWNLSHIHVNDTHFLFAKIAFLLSSIEFELHLLDTKNLLLFFADFISIFFIYHGLLYQ